MKTRIDLDAWLLGTATSLFVLLGTGCSTVRPNICEVHGLEMSKEAIVSGGFSGQSAKYVTPQKKFPHNGAVQGGGCVMFVTVKTYVCPACKEVSDTWWQNRLEKASSTFSK